MITGFNTDVQFEGVTYHVQTEDKGLETPLILSLVYVGGAILASKRTTYHDLIEAGFDEKALAERLQRQHKLICAAIRAGRVEDLKRMGVRDTAARPSAARDEREAPAEVVSTPTPAVVEVGAQPVPPPGLQPEIYYDYEPAVPVATPAPSLTPPPPAPPLEPPADPLPALSAETPPATEATPAERAAEDESEIYLTLLDDEGDFRAGQLATIKIQVGRGRYGRFPQEDADVTVKILGTTFRPLILTTRTDEDGLAVVRALLPRFTSGRAAIIIRAQVGEDHAELRRIIQQSR